MQARSGISRGWQLQIKVQRQFGPPVSAPLRSEDLGALSLTERLNYLPALLVAGGAGEIENVSHVLQPSGRLSASNSQ